MCIQFQPIYKNHMDVIAFNLLLTKSRAKENFLKLDRTTSWIYKILRLFIPFAHR